MKLITKAIEKRLPPLYATEKLDDPIVHAKLFTPDSSWTWYITEYDPEQRLCYGLVHGHEAELGYFSLAELEAVRGPLGLSIERDRFFKPTPISKLKR
jgi:hypothetical protein